MVGVPTGLKNNSCMRATYRDRERETAKSSHVQTHSNKERQREIGKCRDSEIDTESSRKKGMPTEGVRDRLA